MNSKIKTGIGILAVTAAVAVAAVPAFKDVKADKLEKNAVAVAYNAYGNEIKDEIVDSNAVKTEDGEQAAYQAFYPWNSENMEKIGMSVGMDDLSKSVVTPDFFEDEMLRKLAEEYSSQGCIIEDCAYLATYCASGIGDENYAFSNGFVASDATDGNNSFFTEVVKATQEEADWYIKGILKNTEFTVSENGSVTEYTNDNGCELLTISYDAENEILTYKSVFLIEGIG